MWALGNMLEVIPFSTTMRAITQSFGGKMADSKEKKTEPSQVQLSSNEPLHAENKRKKIARIPPAVIKRLSLYARVLLDLEMSNVLTISSKDLAQRLGITSAQVRKDLAYFGQFGIPGVGYDVSDLRANLKRILGTDREVQAILIGVGNLGAALMAYGGFLRHGVRIVKAFDADTSKVGMQRGGVLIYHIDELERQLEHQPIDIAILTVPSEAAQPVTDRLVKAGIIGILNFVPTRLTVPPDVHVHYVDLAIEIESLCYYLR
ncbi:MAG: redox-sensing transcriptional repressor Rex [Candidatus Sumerlaea sp.]|nr:MAG: redox-sensing transcriptional repressor Rex [Candidatus Sumerlaea sp.]